MKEEREKMGRREEGRGSGEKRSISCMRLVFQEKVKMLAKMSLDKYLQLRISMTTRSDKQCTGIEELGHMEPQALT